ncbi:hypothetical protein [Limnohabitans sp. T6-5]|uniref:hypothetical protein n=1 Tax=Limnohabitans sp. T6-5 TaxID=1100724 RepID=UPI0011B22D30|nr:hypothetical protein [Limnohabitans sp. T6-5]
MTSLEQMEAQLKLAPEQQGLWSVYRDRLDAYAQQFYRERPVLPTPQQPAPAQIGRLVMNLQNRLA